MLRRGGVAQLLAVKGDPLDNIEVRVLVPVNMRPAGEIGSLGNYFGLIAMLLPVSIDNPLERLYEVKRRMLELKASPPRVWRHLECWPRLAWRRI